MRFTVTLSDGKMSMSVSVCECQGERERCGVKRHHKNHHATPLEMRLSKVQSGNSL